MFQKLTNNMAANEPSTTGDEHVRHALRSTPFRLRFSSQQASGTGQNQNHGLAPV
jgi:hypothetical protein